MSDPSVTPGGMASATDPLAANGLTSALCRASPPDLSVRTRTNCSASGLSVSPVPIDHYSFDIHIDTPFPPGENTLAIAFQDLVLTPVWTALVWLIHALIVALEWCYAIDLLDSATVGGLSRPLGQAAHLFTEPWMAVVLSIAAVTIAYRGLVRRQVADSVIEALTIAAMMVAGLAIIVAPRETIGSLSALVNDASLGSLAATESGDPRQPDQSLSDGLQALFDGSVQGPWCYLEFGDVDWCRSPGRLDHRLMAAARRLAASDRQSAGCSAATCVGTPGSKQSSLAREAANVAGSRVNGTLFLAFPANGPARNSINDPGSLLHTLCGTYDATSCSGPTAAQAEFRTGSGTWARAGGLLFIVIGIAGMLALLSFICLRLIGAAVLSVFYLLLSPVAVLAPALGYGGRSMFRSWLERLLGAVLAKLVYSVFLGAVLLLVRLLQGMGSLGWWTQWILVAAFWWTVFIHRHRVFEVALLGHRDMSVRGARLASTALANGLIMRRLTGHRQRSRPRLPGPPEPPPHRWPRQPPGPLPPRPPRGPSGPDPGGPGPRVPGTGGSGARRAFGRARSGPTANEQEAGLVPTASARRADAPPAEGARLLDTAEEWTGAPSSPDAPGAAHRARLARLRDQEARARERGEVRRAALLAARIHRLAPDDAKATGRSARITGPAGRAGIPHQSSRSPQALAGGRDQPEAFLDRQNKLRRGVPPGPRADAERYRDYSALSWLVGLNPDRYRALGPAAARRARLAVDRGLRQWDRRRQLPSGAALDPASTGGPAGRAPRAGPGRLPVPRASPAAVRARRARQFLDAVRGERL